MLHKAGIEPAFLHELLVVAGLCDVPVFQDENFVGTTNRREPMGHNDRLATLKECIQGLFHPRFRFGIDVGRRLVQN